MPHRKKINSAPDLRSTGVDKINAEYDPKEIPRIKNHLENDEHIDYAPKIWGPQGLIK